MSWWPTEKFPYDCDGKDGDCGKILTTDYEMCGAPSVPKYYCKKCYPEHFPCSLCKMEHEEKR